MAEWLKATDCKSVPARVRWFESTSAHIFYKANCDAMLPIRKIKHEDLTSLFATETVAKISEDLRQLPSKTKNQ